MTQPPTDDSPMREWSDEKLLQTYEATTGEPGDWWIDQIVAEIERRGLDT